MLLPLHDDGMDIIYFWSSIVMVLLPIGAFTWLTWVLINKARQEMQEKGDGRRT